MPSSPTRYRLRRKDRAQDSRTGSHATRTLAEVELAKIPPAERYQWEIVPQTSGPSGVSTPPEERSRPPLNCTVAKATMAKIDRLAKEADTSRSVIVDRAVEAYEPDAPKKRRR